MNKPITLSIMLSCGVLFSEFFETISKRTDEEILFLATITETLYIQNYSEYINLLTNKQIKEIISETSDLIQQSILAEEIIDLKYEQKTKVICLK